MKQLECYELNSIFLKCLLKDLGAGKTAQCVKVLVTKHGDLSLIPRPHGKKEGRSADCAVVFKWYKDTWETVREGKRYNKKFKDSDCTIKYIAKI